MTSNTVSALVDEIVSNLGEQPDPMYRDSRFESTLRTLALSIRQEMEAEEAAFCRHLEAMYDGWQFTMDCALEGQIGAWVLGK